MSELKSESDQNSPLFNLLSIEDVNGCMRLLESGVDGTAIDSNGNGLFHYAVGIQGRAIVECVPSLFTSLASSGADVNARNYDGKSALHYIGVGTRNYGLPCLKETLLTSLIDVGADLESRDYAGRTPIFSYMNGSDSQAIETLFKAGASLETVDYSGRNLIFHALEQRNMKAVDWLQKEAIQPITIDYNGITAFHAAMIRANSIAYEIKGDKFKSKEELLKINLDPMRPCHAGRTPLHSVTSQHACVLDEHGQPEPYGFMSVFEYVLKQADEKSINIQDNAGITALHIAATFSEYHTRRLLEAGADASRWTHEGLTVIHLACRARQPNILGLVIKSLQTRAGKDEFSQILNRVDKLGRSALYYACASGILEGVSLLIASGAAFDPEMALRGCKTFELENRNWPKEKQLEYTSMNIAGSVTINDTNRSQFRYGGAYPVARLDDIMKVVVQFSPMVDDIDRAISEAAANGCDYTVDCLLEMRQTMNTSPFAFAHLSNASLLRREAIRKVYGTGSPIKSPAIEFLMSERHYSLILATLKEDILNQQDILHDIVYNGFTDLIAALVNPTIIKSKEIELESLLMTACRRFTPNMEMIQLLVEKCIIDVKQKALAPTNKFASVAQAKNRETALHVLARGGHWWQAAQAIPYLVAHGADLEAKDDLGHTPLYTALDTFKKDPNFSIQTFKILVECGADRSALDDENISYLISTNDYPSSKKDLLKIGITLKQDGLIQAIKNYNVDAVRVMMLHGLDPNARATPANDRLWADDGYTVILKDDELYPLHHILKTCTPKFQNAQKKIVRLLLEYGASPNCRYQDTTLGHIAIKENGDFLPYFLRLDELDIEATDNQGLTLLLKCCESAQDSSIQALLDRGAHLFARDNNGYTGLHHFAQRCYGDEVSKSFQFLASNRELINSIGGNHLSPLQTLLGRQYNLSKSHALCLLKSGADPWRIDHHGNTIFHSLYYNGRLGYNDNTDGLLSLFLSLPEADKYVNLKNNEGNVFLFDYFRKKFEIVDELNPEALDPALATMADKLDAAGVDWKVLNNKHQNLLHIVASYRNSHCFKMLLDRGVDAKMEDELGKTPLDIAAAENAVKILALPIQ